MSQQHFGPTTINSATGLHLLLLSCPPCFLSLVLHRYFSPAKANTARRTCASIPTILFMWTLVLSCVCVCTNRCLCTTSSLYVQRSAQNYTTTQSKQIFHQASVTFLDLPIQNGDSSALVLTSSHPIGHSEIHTLWALHDVFWPTKPVDPLVTTALTRLRRLKNKCSNTNESEDTHAYTCSWAYLPKNTHAYTWGWAYLPENTRA